MEKENEQKADAPELVYEEKKSKKEEQLQKLEAKHAKESAVFAALKNMQYKSLLSHCYTEMDSYVEMVLQGISYGTLIEGSGGVGKTFRTLNKALQMHGEENVFYMDSYTTPQSFYIALYKNRNKIIIIDDCMGIMDNLKCLASLKGALWGVNGKRIVQYLTTKPLQDETGNYVENMFEMTGGIIILTNYLNRKNPHMQAVLSRINYCRVNIPLAELIAILTQIAKNPYEDLTSEERQEVLTYLVAKTSDRTEDLNIRTLFKMFMLKRYVKTNVALDKKYWQVLSDKMLQKDDKYSIVEKLIHDPQFASEGERVEAFIAITGKSRATYFKLKKEVEQHLLPKEAPVFAVPATV